MLCLSIVYIVKEIPEFTVYTPIFNNSILSYLNYLFIVNPFYLFRRQFKRRYLIKI